VTVRAYRESIEQAVRPALAQNEALWAVSPLVPDPGTTDDVSISDELKHLLDPLLYVGLGAHPGNLIRRAAFGRASVGSPESTAGRLFDAIGEVTNPTIAVTDTGIVILDVDIEPRGQGWFKRMFGAVDRVATLVHRVPRSNLVGAIPMPRGVLRRGRLLVAFVDGSGCALVCSPPSLAEAVLASIGTPKPVGLQGPGASGVAQCSWCTRRTTDPV
jgi:hypothetical protein